MKPLPMACAAGVAALLLAASATGLPAQTTTGPGMKSEAEPADRGPGWELEISDGVLQMQGYGPGKATSASLKNIIGYLRTLHPANVVLAPGVGDVKVSDLKLAAFEWSQALEALRVASGDAFLWNLRGSGQEVDPMTGMPVPNLNQEALYVLTPNPDAPVLGGRRLVEVFNMAKYLKENEPRQALSDIETILRATLSDLSLGGPNAGPKLQFHRSAGLLIVIGSADELAVARQVLLALPDVTSSKGGYTARAPEAPPAMDPVLMRRYGLMPGPGQQGGMGGGMGSGGGMPPVPPPSTGRY